MVGIVAEDDRVAVARLHPRPDARVIVSPATGSLRAPDTLSALVLILGLPGGRAGIPHSIPLNPEEGPEDPGPGTVGVDLRRLWIIRVRPVGEESIGAPEGGGRSVGHVRIAAKILRHPDLVPGNHQVSAGCQVGLAAVFRLGVVAPLELAGVCIEGVDVGALVRKDPGGEIRLALVNQHIGTNRPDRDHLSIGKKLTGRRRGLELPDQLAGLRLEAIGPSILAAEVELPLPEHRRAVDPRAGKILPVLLRRRGVQRNNPSLHRAGEVDAVAGGDDRQVVLAAFGKTRARRIARRNGRVLRLAGLEGPDLFEGKLQLLRSDRPAKPVPAVGRPVGPWKGDRKEEQHKNKGRAKSVHVASPGGKWRKKPLKITTSTAQSIRERPF